MSLRVLFLGAGKRLSLLEAFQRAAQAEGVALQLHAAETRRQVPIAALARIHPAPGFRDASFAAWLVRTVQALRIDLVVPNMDAATVALSAVRDDLGRAGCWAVVSSPELCVAMEDKAAAEQWFRRRGLRVPPRSGWPRILKRRLGFGSRGQVVVRDPDERDRFLATVDDPLAYLEQDFLEGPEYSVDAYVDRRGRLVGAMPRQRLSVVDGEVDESVSRRHPEIERVAGVLFAEPGWAGPLTAQFIDTQDGPCLLEVNPRFGGGATHAIHCGLDMPRWILRERLERPLPSPPLPWRENSLMVRCRRDIFL